MILHTELGKRGYDIHIQGGVRYKAKDYWNLQRRVLVVTDSGVPSEYAETVMAQCKEAFLETVPTGENSKSMAMLERLLSRMLKEGFSRSDCVVAVGGGVVGDLAGFAAATYMRGIDFYNLPTTLLSQVDSSIGGKVAVNLCGVKNCVGAFHQPKGVLVDPETLRTLSQRQIANGLSEALKMSLTSDAGLFEIFETGREMERLEEVIERSLQIKKAVVEEDETEKGLRKVLNFGHTLGHGIEAAEELHGLYHGECVAMGMIPMCSAEVRERLLPILVRLGFPVKLPVRPEVVLDFVVHDKKCQGNDISTVYVPAVGTFEFQRESLPEFRRRLLPELERMR